MSFYPDIDAAKLKEWFGHIVDSMKSSKAPVHRSGTIVEPTDMTVLETDDYSAFAANQFAATGRIEFTIVSPGYLLLVLSADGSSLRVLCLESGKIGRIDASNVIEYQ